MMQVDIAQVNSYQEQGLLPGKRLFPWVGGRIVLFKKRDVEALMEKLQTEHEPVKGEQNGSANGTGR